MTLMYIYVTHCSALNLNKYTHYKCKSLIFRIFPGTIKILSANILYRGNLRAGQGVAESVAGREGECGARGELRVR